MFDTYFQHLPEPLLARFGEQCGARSKRKHIFQTTWRVAKEDNTEYQCVTTCRGSGQAFCIVDGRGAAVAGVAAAVNMEFCHTFIGS